MLLSTFWVIQIPTGLAHTTWAVTQKQHTGMWRIHLAETSWTNWLTPERQVQVKRVSITAPAALQPSASLNLLPRLRLNLGSSSQILCKHATALPAHTNTSACLCRHAQTRTNTLRLSWMFIQNDWSSDLIRPIWSQTAAH